ncbi:hypothetical protein N9D31_02980, partial [Oligoflexaceae bacterium]|nr:hypothetical protein [Oligoflexaceae bacterium]
NLTAADYVFMMDPWWNPAAELQAQDRAYRIGQDKPVFVERLILEETIEEGILQLQNQKQALREGLIDGLAEPESLVTRDDLLNLLRM